MIREGVGLPGQIERKERHLRRNRMEVPEVCGHHYGLDGCNSGWIKTLEDDADDVVMALGKGDTVELTPDQQRDLAFLAAIIAVMAEYVSADPLRRAITPEQRHALFAARHSHALPPHFDALITQVDPGGDDETGAAHHCWPYGDGDLPSAQQTSIIIGRLILVVQSLQRHDPAQVLIARPPLQRIPQAAPITVPREGRPAPLHALLRLTEHHYGVPT